MNAAESPDGLETDKPDALAVLREHRVLFERAESDLPISEDAKRALAHLDGQERH